MFLNLSNVNRLFRSEHRKRARDFFSQPPTLKPCFHLRQPVAHGQCSFTIQSIATLNQLLLEKKIKKEDPVLRFLVDLSANAWFARETKPGVCAPKHFQMTGLPQSQAKCLTAGNLKFTSRRCQTLKNINHKSGDFRPSLVSLRIFIAILILNERYLPFKLKTILVIKEIDAQGNFIYRHFWTKRRLKAWVAMFAHDTALINQLMVQPENSKSVYYQANAIIPA